MAKKTLKGNLRDLESDIIETLIAGHKEWRPDLNSPESYSDWQGAVRGLLRMFEVKRRPIAIELEYHCEKCNGTGRLIFRPDPEKSPNSWQSQNCVCNF